MSPAKSTSRAAGHIGVNLLPDEIKQAENASTQRRLIVLLTILVVVAVSAAFFGASYSALAAKTTLAAAQAEADRIVAEQANYGGGQQVANQIEITQGAQLLATGLEIEWSALVRDVLAATPASITVTSFEIDSSTTTKEAEAPIPPLEGSRVAAVTVVAVATAPVDIDAWVKSLEKLDGLIGTSVLRLEGQQFTIKVFISEERVTGRFDPELLGYLEPEPVASPTPSATPTPEPTQAPTPTPTPSDGEG